MEITDLQDSDETNANINPYYLLSTVTGNKEFYTRADIEGADRARRYQRLLGCTETSASKTYVNNKIMFNFKITVDYMNRTKNIYGESKPIIKGKMRINIPTVHSKMDKIPLPLPISGRHKNLHLYMDFFR